MKIKELLLKRFNFIMPMVYSDAISYSELMYKMLCKQNEIIDQVNANSQRISESTSSSGRTLIFEGDSKSLCGREHYYLNSMCYAKERNSFFMGFRPAHDYDEQWQGESVIIETDTDFNVLNRKVSTDIGRINDICYANGKLYVAPLYSSWSAIHYRLIELNPDTLNMTTYHYPVASASVCGICYDEANNVFYLDIAPSGTLDHYIYRCNSDFTGATRLANSFFIDREYLVLQSMEFSGNKVIQISNSRNPTGIIYFRTYTRDSQYASCIASLGEEPEGLALKENRLYLATIYNTTGVRIYELSLPLDANNIYISTTNERIELTNANENTIAYDSTGLYLVRNGKNVVVRNSTTIAVSSDVPSGVLWSGSPPAYGMQFGIMVENTTKSVVQIYADSEGNIRNFGTLPTGNYRVILSYICQ